MNTFLRKLWLKANDLALAVIAGLLVFICFALAKFYPLFVEMAAAARLFIWTVTGRGTAERR